MSHTELEIARQQWRRANRRALQNIADKTNYSRTMVSLVFNGHRTSFDGSIEAELRRMDAPGWPRKKEPR